MTVKVCDALMGAGKTQATINYMNEHSDMKFIYVTPYLSEASRIKKGCPSLRFVEPNQKLPEFGFKKLTHTEALVREGRNITTTHQSFKRYTPEMLDIIKKQGYTLIIDENVDVLEKFDIKDDDINLAVNSGYIKKENDKYSLVNDEYRGDVIKEMMSLVTSRDLIRLDDTGRDDMFYWVLPYELISSFNEVIVLTYLFEGQSLYYLLKMAEIPFEYIGVSKNKDGVYQFSNQRKNPDYARNIKNMIHILDNPKLNEIGDSRCALSMNWFNSYRPKVKILKNNIYNCIRNIWSDIPSSDKMWSTYSGQQNRLSGKGYTKSFVSFNSKSTNEYRNKKYLVYAVNIFMNAGEKIFYQNNGIEADDDAYALSIMVQWIWRSAIRDGKEIYIYIPSKRMRNLLINWMDRLSKEGGGSDD